MLKSSDSFSTNYSLNSNSNKEIFTDWMSHWSASKKKPIVFIHGVGLNKEIWKPQIDYFNEYPVLSYDLLGHGKTPLKKTKISFDDFVDQLLSLIDELSFKKIHLVGFSLGALIARHFASRYSDRLLSLTLHGGIYKRSEEQKRIVINRYTVAKTNGKSSRENTLKRWLTNNFISKNPKIYKEILSILENNNRKNFLKSYELFTHYEDDEEIIKKINVNTLITTGENDVGSTPEMSKNLSKLIKGSQFIEIKNGKHLCSIECADDVNITFKKFIDKNND